MRLSIFLVLSVSALICCKEEAPKLEPVKTSKFDEFVRNPISIDPDVDSSEVAKIVFDQLVFNFGDLEQGEKIERIFNFKNEGKSPLIISEARSTCGCTVPEWPKEPIQPGESGMIKVEFDSKGKSGYQDKPISIYANTLPGKTVLRLQGTVN